MAGRGGWLAWGGRRKKGLDRDQVIEGGALLVGEAGSDAVRVERSLTLVGGKIADIAEGVGDGVATVGWKTGELRHRSAHLLALFRGEVLHDLGAGEDTLPLHGRHGVELGEAPAHALLHLRREIVEAGLTLEGTLLLGEGQMAVAVHPLRQMFLVSLGAEGGMLGRSWSAARAGLGTGDGGGGDYRGEEESADGAPRCEVALHNNPWLLPMSRSWDDGTQAGKCDLDESTGFLLLCDDIFMTLTADLSAPTGWA